MDTTYIGFSTPKKFNPLSWLIKVFTTSKVSHTWFMYHDMDFDTDIVMEAHTTGFRIIPYVLFEEKNKIIAVIDRKLSPLVDFGLTIILIYLELKVSL